MGIKKNKKQKKIRVFWLKDLLIPHARNNYHPHLFHNQRFILHSLGIIGIKAIVSIFIFFYPLIAWMTPDIQKQTSREIFSLTNQLRKKLNIDQLKYNYLLEQSAISKAQDMLAKQYFAHFNNQGQGVAFWVGRQGYQFSIVGEILSMGYNSASDIFLAWKNSPTHYANLVNKNFQDIGLAVMSGPYQGIETMFAVQHFGKPKKNIKKTAVIQKNKNIGLRRKKNLQK